MFPFEIFTDVNMKGEIERRQQRIDKDAIPYKYFFLRLI